MKALWMDLRSDSATLRIKYSPEYGNFDLTCSQGVQGSIISDLVKGKTSGVHIQRRSSSSNKGTRLLNARRLLIWTLRSFRYTTPQRYKQWNSVSPLSLLPEMVLSSETAYDIQLAIRSAVIKKLRMEQAMFGCSAQNLADDQERQRLAMEKDFFETRTSLTFDLVISLDLTSDFNSLYEMNHHEKDTIHSAPSD